MRAVRVSEPGGPGAMQLEEVPDPSPGAGQVLVRVAAAGVNFIDTYQRSGAYPMETPFVLGLEGAGEIVAVGEGVDDAAVGRTVAWAGALGSYADLVVADAEAVVPVPDGVPAEAAAALMLQGMTAHYLSHSTFAVGRDDTALVYAAAGGVGRLLTQLAVRRGARVIGLTSTDAKEAEARRLGADAVIRYRDEGVVISDEARRLTDGRGVQVVYDSVGADTFDQSLRSLAPRGTLVLFGQSSGPVPPIDLQTLNQHGSLFVTRPSLGAYTATPDELTWRATSLFDLFAAGELDVAIHERYPLEDAARAHEDLASGSTSGKLLLVP
ncbi:MAG: quinone oxidoreductase [Nitriliruptor sp.]